MTTLSNGTAEVKQQTAETSKTYRRSPYREPTRVMRIPESLIPRVRKMLLAAKSEVQDHAWLEGK